jgi:hypothetical protein
LRRVLVTRKGLWKGWRGTIGWRCGGGRQTPQCTGHWRQPTQSRRRSEAKLTRGFGRKDRFRTNTSAAFWNMPFVGGGMLADSASAGALMASRGKSDLVSCEAGSSSAVWAPPSLVSSPELMSSVSNSIPIASSPFFRGFRSAARIREPLEFSRAENCAKAFGLSTLDFLPLRGLSGSPAELSDRFDMKCVCQRVFSQAKQRSSKEQPKEKPPRSRRHQEFIKRRRAFAGKVPYQTPGRPSSSPHTPFLTSAPACVSYFAFSRSLWRFLRVLLR